jgi:hypothetical protein
MSYHSAAIARDSLLSESMALKLSDRADRRVSGREADLAGMAGRLECREDDFSLHGREAWIFISIKNRRFNRRYVDWFIDLCQASSLEGRICAVDDPYRFNRMAELKIDILAEEEAAKIERLSSDIQRMAQKALNGKRADAVSMVSWRELAEETPPQLKSELRRGFENSPAIRKVLRDHIGSVKDFESDECFRRYAEFFLCEVPVLMHAYYRSGGAFDIYPGPQVDFFWQIETGIFEEELPQLTALTRTGRPLLYMETFDQDARAAA